MARGCCLLPAGSIADIAGSRFVNIAGTLTIGAFSAASGGAKTGVQFIACRAMQGIGAAMCFPTAISIISNTFRPGRFRNVSLAALACGQPLGFQTGLILAGAFSGTSLRWRFPFHLYGGLTIGFFAVSFPVLPGDGPRRASSWSGIAFGIDWVGILISSTSLGCLSYVLAWVRWSRVCLLALSLIATIHGRVITGALSAIHDPVTVALLVVACVLAIAFAPWMQYQEKRGKPALIPNSLWKELAFSCICVVVFLSWAIVQSFDWFVSLL